MIQWMQRHKKYLIITIWISTIAFVGAGFVGWGQYSYGDKAGSVAKVGNVDITMGELQKTYSDLYSQYNKMFQGNFDEEKAKSFGLQKQALKQLINQALVINLAHSYDLEVSDEELLNEIRTQSFFFKDGVFNKEIYKEVLLRNNRNLKEYEADVRKELLIGKTFKLLPVKVTKNEEKIIDTIVSIADKIDYKILTDKQINIDTSDAALKPYWETQQQNFMSEVEYVVEYIKQERLTNKFEEGKIVEHYNANKTHFKDDDSKILPLEGARASVIIELNDKATKDAALRGYIAYKKDKLKDDVEVLSTTISASNNSFGVGTFEKISKLSPSSQYLKPVIVNDEYFTFKLIKTNPSKIKSFQEAKADILPLYIKDQKRVKLLELANNSIATFKGTVTDFITNSEAIKLTKLPTEQANEFLIALFSSKEKRGFVTLKNGDIVLYNVLEQKLLSNTNTNPNNSIVRLKSAMFNEGLIKNLQNKYKTEIFIEGL